MIDAYAARLPEAERAGLKADYAELGGSSFGTLPPAAFGKIINTLPLTDMPVVRRAPWWQDWLKNRDNPTFFKNNEMTDRFKNVDVPILHLGGWYDLFQRNTIENFKGISTQAKSGFARRNQHLIIGQWSHGSCIGCPSNAAFNAEALQFAWMDRWFRNRQFTVFSHPVILYVMGENRWRAENSWPLPNTVRTRYYLHSRGNANSAAGDGALSTSPPDAEAPDHFEYDPAHPAPSLGGPGLSGSRADQKVAEARNDVLVYSTPPLVDDVEVTGEIGATLYAATSATDTDWWMKLIDVDAAGKPEILAQGVVRARYRSSRTNPAPTQPGKIEKYSMNMWATSNVFKKGHRIRVEVTSSNFPYADRNPNAFVNLSTATEKDFVVASQTVFHSESGASFIELPIIPASRQRLWIDPPDQGLPK
jgi:putative CocE/NonD family hydrolase